MFAIGLTVAAALAGCAAPTPTPSDGPPPLVRAPTQDRAALEACMAAAGYVVHPGESGSNGIYSWERTSRFTWPVPGERGNIVAATQCEAQFAPPRVPSNEELREIYDRWVLEAQCLIGLGFHPRPPPSFSEFARDYEAGPWMPIDGVPFDRITRDAKAKCGLEMVD